MAFPSPGDEIYRNEDGEPVGWSKPADANDYYCDICGFGHLGPCSEDSDEDFDAMLAASSLGSEQALAIRNAHREASMSQTSETAFTEQDRKDVKEVLFNLFVRVVDEFDDSGCLREMYRRYAKFIVQAAMIGDEAFGDHILPELEKQGVTLKDLGLTELLVSPSIDDDELQQACKRILGSGRFDYFEED